MLGGLARKSALVWQEVLIMPTAQDLLIEFILMSNFFKSPLETSSASGHGYHHGRTWSCYICDGLCML